MEYIPVFFFGLSKIDQETDENGKIHLKNLNVQLTESYWWFACCSVHVGADMTEIHAKRGFRFVDPYEKKTILNLNGSVWYVNPASINAFTVAGDALVTHRVRECTTLQTNLEKLFLELMKLQFSYSCWEKFMASLRKRNKQVLQPKCSNHFLNFWCRQ